MGGLVLLTLGAEWLVRGASRVAASLGVAPLVVGLTVVAVGTSLPEVMVTVGAALEDKPEIGVGNVLGSNIFNVLFILGASALLAPLAVSRRVVRVEVPLLIALCILAWAMASDGRLGRLEGALLLGVGVVYTWILVRMARRGRRNGRGTHEREEEHPTESHGRRLPSVLLALAGLVLLSLGAHWLIRGASAVALALGVSELVVGLTLVAGGTSLPEVATSLVATLRGERDLAVGNVIGSNLYNLVIVLAAGALLAPDGLPVAPGVLAFDFPVMTVVAVACLPIFFTGGRIARWEGGVFLLYYAAYVAFLFLETTDHATVPVVGRVMMLFVLPLTAITLLVITVSELRDRTGR